MFYTGAKVFAYLISNFPDFSRLNWIETVVVSSTLVCVCVFAFLSVHFCSLRLSCNTVHGKVRALVCNSPPVYCTIVILTACSFVLKLCSRVSTYFKTTYMFVILQFIKFVSPPHIAKVNFENLIRTANIVCIMLGVYHWFQDWGFSLKK